MKYKVFIDGAEGTTGLKIHSYFQKRNDIDIISIDEKKRKDPEERVKMIKNADVSFLCLPDVASREIVAAVPKECRILDTSTAHRTNDNWVYGMPELSAKQRERIRESNRIAVPGCHATGVILLTKPLISCGVLPDDYHFSAFSLTGYSGGGKKMIAQYEDGNVSKSPRQYALSQAHKHLPEIMKMAGMKKKPAFMPVVSDYYRGMEVTIPIDGDTVMKTAKGNFAVDVDMLGAKEAIKKLLCDTYEGESMIGIDESLNDDGFIAADRMAASNRLKIAVEGNDENIILIAVYDNLGKGASGAAVQNMNIMLGIDEMKGLV